MTPWHASAQLGGLGGLMGGKSSSERAPAGGDVVAQQDQLVKEYVAADRGVLRGEKSWRELHGLPEFIVAAGLVGMRMWSVGVQLRVQQQVTQALYLRQTGDFYPLLLKNALLLGVDFRLGCAYKLSLIHI